MLAGGDQSSNNNDMQEKQKTQVSYRSGRSFVVNFGNSGTPVSQQPLLASGMADRETLSAWSQMGTRKDSQDMAIWHLSIPPVRGNKKSGQ